VDAGLNQLRAWLLREHGFYVVTTESVDQAQEHIERNRFDVLIFGSTLSRDTCWTLAEVFRKNHARGRIIEILPSPWAAPKNQPDATVVGSDEPLKLIAAIQGELSDSLS
jgi:hypothetical protein